MATVKMYKKVVERYKTPDNQDTNNHIRCITKEFVEQFDTEHIPMVNEVIVVGKNKYIVNRVIRKLNFEYPYGEVFILEVGLYNTLRVYTSGSDIWTENIPLVVDLEY